MRVLLVSVCSVLSFASVRAEPSKIIDERAVNIYRKKYKSPSFSTTEKKTENIEHSANAAPAEPSVIEHNWGYCQNLEFLRGHWTGSNSKGVRIDEWWEQSQYGELIGIRKVHIKPDNTELQLIVVRDPQNSAKTGARVSIHQFNQALIASDRLPIVGNLAVQSDGITIAYKDTKDRQNYFHYKKIASVDILEELLFKADSQPPELFKLTRLDK